MNLDLSLPPMPASLTGAAGHEERRRRRYMRGEVREGAAGASTRYKQRGVALSKTPPLSREGKRMLGWCLAHYLYVWGSPGIFVPVCDLFFFVNTFILNLHK